MNAPPTDSLPAPEAPIPTGLLLSRDLIFTSKITGTARELGYRFLVAGNVALARTMIEQQRPRVILVDLAAGEVVSPQSLIAYQQLAGPQTPLVAFGSHVDTESLAAAREAGCAEVMPRSKFSAELPALIRRFLD